VDAHAWPWQVPCVGRDAGICVGRDAGTYTEHFAKLTVVSVYNNCSCRPADEEGHNERKQGEDGGNLAAPAVAANPQVG
jgi:hypothetical protein